MTLYKFHQQDGRIMRGATQGPRYPQIITLKKNAAEGTGFEEQKAGALASLHGDESRLADHPEELRAVRRWIAQIEDLDGEFADLMPDGENPI